VAGPALHWQTVAHTDAATQSGMRVRYARQPWGTTMQVQVWGIRQGSVCQFLVVDAHGQRSVLGGWRVNYARGPAWYPVSTSLTDRQLRTFEVTAGGQVVASVPAA
jgi:hypothetical protein